MNAQRNGNTVYIIRINGSVRYAICFPRELYEGECKFAKSELQRIAGGVPFSYGYAGGRSMLVLDCFQKEITPQMTDGTVSRLVDSILISIRDCRRDTDIIEVVADHQARAAVVSPIQGVPRY